MCVTSGVRIGCCRPFTEPEALTSRRACLVWLKRAGLIRFCVLTAWAAEVGFHSVVDLQQKCSSVIIWTSRSSAPTRLYDNSLHTQGSRCARTKPLTQTAQCSKAYPASLMICCCHSLHKATIQYWQHTWPTLEIGLGCALVRAGPPLPLSLAPCPSRDTAGMAGFTGGRSGGGARCGGFCFTQACTRSLELSGPEGQSCRCKLSSSMRN